MEETDPYLEKKIREFISEDLGFGDITTDSIIDDDVWVTATIVCKEDAVISGLKEAVKIFELLGCIAKPLIKEGSQVKAGTRLIYVEGSGRAVLKGERTALNLLMRMSGIATATWRALSKARRVNSKVRIACTRKTAPGLRYFDKKAVRVGGGDTHRFRLDDCILIKDNHIRIVGSVRKAIEEAKRKTSFTKKIEVEVENLEDALEAAMSGADIIMLDNMRSDEISKFLIELERRELRDKVIIEASGGINEKNIEEYAKIGVDVISIGAITHSVKAIDMSLEIEDVETA